MNKLSEMGIAEVEAEAAKRIKKVLMDRANTLFGTNFPETTYVQYVMVDGSFHHTETTSNPGIVCAYLNATHPLFSFLKDKLGLGLVSPHYFLVMLREGLYLFCSSREPGHRWHRPFWHMHQEVDSNLYILFAREVLETMEKVFQDPSLANKSYGWD